MTTDIRKPKGDIDDFWDEFDWDELSMGEQKAFVALGWDQEKWDDDGDIPAADKDWDELTPKQQAALKALGYDETYWDS
jgi:hypothetical protein